MNIWNICSYLPNASPSRIDIVLAHSKYWTDLYTQCFRCIPYWHVVPFLGSTFVRFAEIPSPRVSWDPTKNCVCFCPFFRSHFVAKDDVCFFFGDFQSFFDWRFEKKQHCRKKFLKLPGWLFSLKRIVQQPNGRWRSNNQHPVFHHSLSRPRVMSRPARRPAGDLAPPTVRETPENGSNGTREWWVRIDETSIANWWIFHISDIYIYIKRYKYLPANPSLSRFIPGYLEPVNKTLGAKKKTWTTPTLTPGTNPVFDN